MCTSLMNTMGCSCVTEQTKTVKVVEWNSLRREIRRQSLRMRDLEETLNAQAEMIDVLRHTLLVPAGKVLGSK